MFALIRGLFAMGIGWLLMKIVNNLLAGMQLRSEARSEQIQKPRPGRDYSLEMKPCPRCGVYTTTPCSNPECAMRS